LNTTGVVPALMVAGVAWVVLKLPATLSLWKKFTPAEMLPAAPPSARLAIITPFSAALACVGLPLSATEFLNLLPSSWFSDVMVPNLAEL
jgi:hypothetical protein